MEVRHTVDIRPDDVLQLKKPHACGTNEWHVYRVGLDMGLRCRGCKRMMLIKRSKIERRVRSIQRAGQAVKPVH